MVVQGAWKALGWIAVAVLFSLSLWYSATVVVNDLMEYWNLSSSLEGWLSASIPLGFVIGTFISSYVGLADKYHPRTIFAISALFGAIFNLLMIFTKSGIIGIALRILTGITLAGVYPIAVKILSHWFPKNRGLAVGILIAALTIGTSLPHFIVMIFSSLHWKLIIVSSSILAFIAAIIITFLLEDNPVQRRNAPFSMKLIKNVIKNKHVMLANYGYFGHMWELYAMWTWLPAFLTASFTKYLLEVSITFIAFTSFASIGIAGAVGCVVGGILSDKIGRANLTIVSMLISGICCILIGFTYGKAIWLTLIIAIIWGIAIIADSAQFSVAVSEVSEIDYVGTALTFQMCIGFLLTIVSINILPIIQRIIGWEWAFTILSIGPFLGIIAMYKYRESEHS